MTVTVKLDKTDIYDVYELACSTNEQVYVHSLDDTVKIDAKSNIGLMWLRFDNPVKIVSENESVCGEAKRRWGISL